MAIEGIFYVATQVADLERTKRFFAGTLGWTLNTDESYVAGFWFGNAYLVAQKASGPITPGAMHVEVRVDDLDDQHRRLTEAGIPVSAIETRPWGERNFTFTDPDGYLWSYGQAS